MLRGPQDRKRPADAGGHIVTIARSATGEGEEMRYERAGKAKSGRAGR